IAPYYCKAPNCPYRSTQGCDVYKHVLRVHFHQASKQIMPLDLSKRSNTPYVCTIEKCMNCVFKTKKALLNHKRVHQGINPSYCNVDCDARPLVSVQQVLLNNRLLDSPPNDPANTGILGRVSRLNQSPLGSPPNGPPNTGILGRVSSLNQSP